MIPVILSGGSGTRLWPLSREFHPKQFLSLEADSPTLFQSTLARLRDLADAEAPIVVANDEHRFLAAEQLRESDVADATLVLEPAARNTAPALAAAALAASEVRPDALLLALPADHVIRDVQAFHAAVATGLEAARSGRLVAFGIVPDAPETAFGYIHAGPGGSEAGPWPVAGFVEKPDAARATEFLRTGDYLWNSGMLLLRADRYLEELARFAPEVIAAVEQSWAGARRDLDFVRLDAETFARSPSISVDYAVMEHTADAVVVPLDAGWSDAGSWEALAAMGAHDANDNVVIGDVVLEDTERSYVRAGSRLVAVVGVSDHIVVETPDAVLVAGNGKGHSRALKALVARLAASGRTESVLQRRVHRPWGWYETMVSGPRFQVKHILVNPSHSLSLQLHRHRAEHWTVVRGTAEVVKGEETFLLGEDESAYIPIGTRHRLGNPGKLPLELIEVQTGSYLGEDDIVRFDDDYGRSENGGPAQAPEAALTGSGAPAPGSSRS